MPAANTMFGASIGATATRSPNSGFAQTQVPLQPGASAQVYIDGTPLRVITFVALAAGGIIALRWAGFKFHVTTGV
jgi:hypothetical protein